ncbi:uncharacterized protein LOC18039182 isoform X1 [Citrus clementina]|uniref:uncharacterized protein LOC18039182 isoform X1 n=1 Tax=Citrus clementina TaxID=85681 RepID=UPI000CED0E61|nr:uncharacterized protein LOC18039182 isoform X1 [Citrus x clementina]
MSPANGFVSLKLVLIGCSFWVYASALFLALFGLFNKFLFRAQGDENSEKKNSNCLAASTSIKPEPELDEAKSDSVEFHGTENSEEVDTPNFFFKFKFQTYEEFSKSDKGNFDFIPSTSTSKYEFKSDNYSSSFFEEPKDVSFTVKELCAGARFDSFANQHSEDEQVDEEEQVVDEDERESCKDNVCKKEEEEEDEQNCEDALGDTGFLSENDFIAKDSDSGSIASSNEDLFTSQFVGSTSEGFLSDTDFAEASENVKSNEFDDEACDTDIMEELEELEESNVNFSKTTQEFGRKDNDEATSSVKNCNNDSKMHLDSEDSNGLETLWEHQDLIDQLKTELKKARAIGLPTILEESESPKITEDLKPWKIDEKFQHEDTMGELHKFYKSYRERMRKFDILNYQKMYTIGFLQSKDPLQSISGLKFSPPGVTSVLSQNFLLSKRKKSEFDPMKQFIRELHSDLEVVYVGQLCLSWEILHWQYEKSLELWESDPYGICRYNEVAGEFQQFQVLMQRFIENEPFEGPRVENYIKNRCVLRNLLQVPVIREDSKKDKKARMKMKDEYAITSDMLVEIMEESIRIFWRFVRVDKDANIMIQKSRKGTQIEPQDALDLGLLAEVRTSLQKVHNFSFKRSTKLYMMSHYSLIYHFYLELQKEKKLKEILRSGNCILRKFQKQQENSDQVLYFFSQVDMKLVARVLNMTKLTTDQLLWCRNKLDKINFISRRIHVEPAFLLFPC